MAGRSSLAMAMVALLLFFFSNPGACLATIYSVGGTQGWNLDVNFTAWSAQQSFVIGDIIVFRYGSSHSVIQVSEEDYNACNIHDPISSPASGTEVPLQFPSVYFICNIPGHCVAGMKVAIFASEPASTFRKVPVKGNPKKSTVNSVPLSVHSTAWSFLLPLFLCSVYSFF